MKKIAWWLVVIGALNWGLIGIGYFLNSNLNLVNLIFGRVAILEAAVYIVVGVAGVLLLIPEKKQVAQTVV